MRRRGSHESMMSAIDLNDFVDRHPQPSSRSDRGNGLLAIRRDREPESQGVEKGIETSEFRVAAI